MSAPVSRSVELVAEGGRNGGVPAIGRMPQSCARIGVRMNLNPVAEAPRSAVGTKHAGSVVAHVEVAAGASRLIVTAPAASAVEIKGDFTIWTALAMEPAGAAQWSVDVPVGVVHFNVRVDRGEWGVPTGVPVVPDDFTGAPVAVVLVSVQ